MNSQKRNWHFNELPTYIGQFKTQTHIQVIRYTSHDFFEKKITDIAEIQSYITSDSVTWIRVSGMSDSTKIIELIKSFDLRILDSRRILTAQNIMSVEESDKNLLIIMPVLYAVGGETKIEQVVLIMGKNYVVTIQESNHPFFAPIYAEIKNEKFQKFNNRKSDFLLALMVGEIINNCGDEVARLENNLEELEDKLLDVRQIQDAEISSDIQEQRRKMIRMRKLLLPFKGGLAKLLRVDSDLICTQATPYYKDIYDQLLFLLQNLESCREILSSLIDLYLNNNDLKMNVVMKQLTLVSTIFIPLTFLVGVWGMNFKFMPELEYKHGYLIAWALMIGIGLAIWWYMKRKKWF